MARPFEKPFIRKARGGMHEGRWVIAAHRGSRMIYELNDSIVRKMSFASQREAFDKAALWVNTGQLKF